MRSGRPIIIILWLLCLMPQRILAEETLSWQDCILEAKKNHPDLIYAAEGVKEKKAAKSVTASGLYPQINASVDASRAKTTTSSSGKETTTTRDSYSYGVSGSQLIFDGLKTVQEMKAASEEVKGARENFRYTSSQVRYNLRAAFIGLLRAQEMVRVAQDIVRIRRDNLVLITLRYESGLEHKGALLAAQANLAQANFELSQAKRNLETSQYALSRQLGRKQFSPISVAAGFELTEPLADDPDFEKMIHNNPSVLAAAAKTNSQAFSLKSAQASFFPELSASAGANKSSSRWPPKDSQWDMALGVSLPIFEGGLKFAQVSRARALYNQAASSERSIREAAMVNLRQYWAGLQDAAEKVDVQRKSLEASEERSRIAEGQYSVGFISFDNWIIIENDLVSAKRSFLESQADSLLAEAGWILAKGETLEYAQ